MNISIKLVDADPDQPRQEFDPVAMDKLEISIKAQGILVPLILEKNYKPGRYLIIDGERRYRTSKKLGLKELPAILIEGPLTREERMIRRFHIQEQVSSWSPFDKARAIYFFKKAVSLSNKEIAEMLGLHQTTIQNWISLLSFSSRAQTKIIERRISFSYLVKIIRAVKLYQEITTMAPEKIEHLLIDKIDNGILKNFTALTLCIAYLNIPGNEDRKKKFLITPNYTLYNMLGQTPEGQSIQLDKVCHQVNSLTNVIKKAQHKKLHKHLSPTQRLIFEKLITTLNEFIT